LVSPAEPPFAACGSTDLALPGEGVGEGWAACDRTVWQTAGNWWGREGLLWFSGFHKACLGCSGDEGNSLRTSESWGRWERG